MAGEHRRIELRVWGREEAERLVAEAFSAGALGVEERGVEERGAEERGAEERGAEEQEAEEGSPEDRPGEERAAVRPGSDEAVALIVYSSAEDCDSLHTHLCACASEPIDVGPVQSVEEVDWSEAWKQGLEPIVVSERLVVRPSFVPHRLAAGQRELVIDPGQAFGTGGHASTLLVLRWIDALLGARPSDSRSWRVLDVGTGTGVLAMASLRLGAARAVAFDLDHIAVKEAALAARRNEVSDALLLYTGPLSALRAAPFELVVVNLLRREMLPIASEIAAAVQIGGFAVLSGLMRADRHEVLTAFAAQGLVLEDELTAADPSGGQWISPLLKRA